MSTLTRSALLVALIVALPAAVVYAQTVAGVVRDGSGAVMPGATVEVSRPALIEETRSAITAA